MTHNVTKEIEHELIRKTHDLNVQINNDFWPMYNKWLEEARKLPAWGSDGLFPTDENGLISKDDAGGVLVMILMALAIESCTAACNGDRSAAIDGLRSNLDQIANQMTLLATSQKTIQKPSRGTQ